MHVVFIVSLTKEISFKVTKQTFLKRKTLTDCTHLYYYINIYFLQNKKWFRNQKILRYCQCERWNVWRATYLI